jgi:hypothetical protein
MDSAISDGRESSECSTCSQCGRILTMKMGVCQQPHTAGAAICDDCYAEMLVPGPGDAHGSMS